MLPSSILLYFFTEHWFGSTFYVANTHFSHWCLKQLKKVVSRMICIIVYTVLPGFSVLWSRALPLLLNHGNQIWYYDINLPEFSNLPGFIYGDCDWLSKSLNEFSIEIITIFPLPLLTGFDVPLNARYLITLDCTQMAKWTLLSL